MGRRNSHKSKKKQPIKIKKDGGRKSSSGKIKKNERRSDFLFKMHDTFREGDDTLNQGGSNWQKLRRYIDVITVADLDKFEDTTKKNANIETDNDNFMIENENRLLDLNLDMTSDGFIKIMEVGRRSIIF
eukprot:GHVH01000719.1.p1 GENE.GHVH01000719.1~~GHVH01000719.1.p1  ORF type:complete len:130 (+),score=16.36 GHVH01000719.1:215-604(+)